MSAKLGASVAVVGLFLYAGPAHVASVAAAAMHRIAHSIHAAAAHGGTATLTAAHGGTLGCHGLERLWVQAGGSRGAAFTAAEIAMAESSGRQYAVNTNGGRSTDRGYFQVNSIHGALSTYDPLGNAKAAVAISDNGRNWRPWVTYNSGAYRGRC